MKVHIIYPTVDGPWGGANQFLKALRETFRRRGVYAETPDAADAVLVNSHHALTDALRLKQRRPETVLVHRLDGPVYDIRHGLPITDRLIYGFNRRIADGTILQSGWCRNANRRRGLDSSPYETTIVNAPDPSLFHRPEEESSPGDPTKLIATSWSANMRKGFDVYRYLDQHLDFDRYQFTFLGNTPVEFENVRWKEPVPSEQVAEHLKAHDIFVTASRSDPCSNALLEALHCGLPAVARDDGGHPELVGDGGELFEDGPGAVRAIERVVDDYEGYREAIDLPTLDTVADRYYEFIAGIVEDAADGSYRPKRLVGIEAVTYPIALKSLLTARAGLNKLPVEVA